MSIYPDSGRQLHRETSHGINTDSDMVMHDPPAGPPSRNMISYHVDPTEFEAQGSIPAKRASEDDVDRARPAKIQRLMGICKRSIFNKLIDLTICSQRCRPSEN